MLKKITVQDRQEDIYNKSNFPMDYRENFNKSCELCGSGLVQTMDGKWHCINQICKATGYDKNKLKGNR